MTHTILAARTEFSVGESILSIDQLVEAAKAAGQTAVAICDTMSVTALIEFTKAAKKADLKPIIGCRLRLTDDAFWRPEKGQKKKHMPRDYFLNAYALTEDGLKAIYRLLSLGGGEERFYYVPKLGFDDLAAELKLAGPEALALVPSDTHSLLEHPEIDTICATLATLTNHFYVPIIPVNTPYHGRLNQIAHSLHVRFGYAPLAVRPALYAQDEADAQEIMTAICGNHTIHDGWFRSRHNRDLHPMNALDFAREARAAGAHLNARGVTGVAPYLAQAMHNTHRLVDAVGFAWEKQPVSLPQMAPDEYAALVEECKKGWAARFTGGQVFGHRPGANELSAIYMPRLKYELEILKKLNFSGYFLLVQDIVRFAKTNGILVGPGRGSVGGSLVAYLMGITECDPIRFGLLFERFINPERLDLPDADLDFMSERRHEIVEYLIGKYGVERVAGVSNFSTLASASAIRSVGKAMGVPEKDYSVSKLAPKAHGANVPLKDCAEAVPEIAGFASEHDWAWDTMLQLEGKVRNFSQHAAGVVVGGCDLVERGVVERRSENAVMNWDKRVIEEQGLVKVDVLGLTTLDLIGLTLDYVEERHRHRPDIGAIPLDDPDVLKRFAEGQTTAVFQFESGGMRRLLKELGADGTITFEDITAATALYRPGPMESGMMDSFWKRKQGLETIEYDHPLMEEVLKETFGVIVYQEQVMQVARVIAGYSGADADKLRKIMGKKQPEEMKKERSKFVAGCVATIQCDEGWAGHLFDKIEGFAGYGFNKSHSVEYTLISYQAMWLKTRYPIEFFAAALTMLDEDKLPAILRDAKTYGIAVIPPDINYSSDRFEIITDKLLAMPFQRIKGISTNTAKAILDARATPFKDKADFIARVERRKCNVSHQAKLDAVGAFARLEPGQVPATHPDRIKDQVELLPGLISAAVPIHRDMHRDKVTKEGIAQLVDEYRAEFGPGADVPDGMPVKPSFGKGARFMLIADAPGGEEDSNGQMGLATTANAVIDALSEAGLTRNDAYWTALVKRPKRGKQLSAEEIAAYRPYLDREIEILKPPVIVLCGTAAVRAFFPTFKGKASDQAGKITYMPDLDANIVLGFNPGEVFYAPEKQDELNKVFATVAELLA